MLYNIKKSAQKNRHKLGKIKRAEITALSRQIATLLMAGIPLLQTLEIAARGQNNLKVKTLILEIKRSIEKGNSVTETLANYPQYFSGLYRNLIMAGERSGSLDHMFERLAGYQEKMDFILGKIKKALFYPSAIMIIATLITIFLLIFIVPQFQTLFTGFGAQLPTATLFVIQCSQFLQTYGWILLSLMSMLIVALVMMVKRSIAVANFLEQLLLIIPLLGVILKQAILARFARTLATTFAAGLPLVEALQIAAKVCGNHVYTKAILKVAEDIKLGHMLHFSLRQQKIFPNFLVQMCAVGEESGTLEKMLLKVAEIYEREVDNAVEGLSSLLEPIIMVVLGLIIGGLVIAMYLPIFKLGSLA